MSKPLLQEKGEYFGFSLTSVPTTCRLTKT